MNATASILTVNLEAKSQSPSRHPILPNPNFFIMICGPRGSGKSVIVRNMLLRSDMYRKDFQINNIFIFSPTLEFNDDYEDIKTRHKFHEDIKQTIQEAMDKQIGIIRAYGKKRTPRLLLVLDDILDDKITAQKGLLDTLSARGRHINISVIVISQKINGIPRTARLNSDAVIAYLPFNYSELESFVLQYFPKSQQKKLQEKLISIYSKAYSFIYINNQMKTIDGKIYHNFGELIDFKSLED